MKVAGQHVYGGIVGNSGNEIIMNIKVRLELNRIDAYLEILYGWRL